MAYYTLKKSVLPGISAIKKGPILGASKTNQAHLTIGTSTYYVSIATPIVRSGEPDHRASPREIEIYESEPKVNN
jgi:hypothetical protein